MNEFKPIGINTAISLLSEVFGQPIYSVSASEEKQNIESYNVSFLNSDETPDRMSQFGTAVFGSFTIGQGEPAYVKYDVMTNKLVSANVSNFEFPLATIVDFSRDKYITKTPTIGSAGTVKEIFGFEDWKINIRGICLNDESRSGQKTANEQKLMLIKLNEIAGALKIEKGLIFTEKDIHSIVIEKLSFSAIQGKPQMIPFEIEATSDFPFLLSV